MAVRLSALRAGRPLPPRRFLVLVSCTGWADHRAIVQMEGLGQLNRNFSLFSLITVNMEALILIVVFDVLATVIMKISAFFDTTPCSPLKINRHFEGTCRLHCQDRRISEERNCSESGIKQSFTSVSCFASSTFKMEAICSSETSADF
jgi:hypothetical protein